MIRARGVGRRFGEKRVLAGVDLDVGAGALLLVTGPNGAGKTTLLRLIAGLIVPTSGELEVAAGRARIGFLAHEPLVYRELTPLENLELYGRLYRVRERRRRGSHDRRRQPPARAARRPSDLAPRARVGMTAYLSDVVALTRKDLLVELRSRDTVPAMLLFVVGGLVIFHFALVEDASRLASAGMLWIALLFTALLALVRSFVAERDEAVIDGLLLAPCDRSAIWLGKTLTVVAFLALAELVALPAFALFYEPVTWELVAGVALANIGIAAVGTLLGAMAAAARARELLLPLLFMPLAIPLIVGGVGATLAEDPARYLGFLALYDLIFAILSWASFEYVVTE